MKNVKLFGFLVLLLTFTYFFQEIGTKKSKETETQKTTLIDSTKMGELKELKGPLFHLVRESGNKFKFKNPQYQNRKIDIKKMDKFFEVLSGLRVVRDISELNGMAKTDFIPKDSKKIQFIFKDDFLSFSLGNKIETDQTFYVLIESKDESKILIAKDISAHEGSFNKETFYKNDLKYRRQASLFVATDDFFQRKNILNERLENWKSIGINNTYRKDFKITIDNSSMQTLPPKFDGIEYNKKKFLTFTNKVLNLTALEIVNKTRMTVLNDYVSQLVIEKKNGVNIYLSLYKNYNNTDGNYVVLGDQEEIYKVTSEMAQPFFVNIQDFWLRKPSQFEKVNNLILAQKNKSFELERKVGKKIEYKVLKTKEITAHHRNVEKLVKFFNQDSDRISLFDKFDKELYPDSLFNLKIDGKEFKVIKTEVELLLVDLKSQLKYHFYTGRDVPFSKYIKDYILKELK